MASRNRIRTLTVAAGAVTGLTAIAAAQPTVIHMSGATLLENYVKARAATVDYIDVDGDKFARGIPNSAGADQLAPFFIPADCGDAAEATYPASMHWAFFYSSVGSTRGLQELIDNGKGWNTGNATSSVMGLTRRSKGFFNRYQYINGGVGFDDFTNPDDPDGLPNTQNFVNEGNAGGFIYRSQRDDIMTNPSPFKAIYTDPNIPGTSPGVGGCTVTRSGGVGVDIAILDVPVFYAVRQVSAVNGTAFFRLPGQPGYGDNPIQPRNPDGTPATGAADTLSAKLASLTPSSGAPNTQTANLNFMSPDANTIFDTPLFFAPIAPITNFGVGMEGIGGKSGILMTDLRALFVTGRLTTGENLVAVTRDSGSGTRNGFNNSTGTDPSWGVGENVGARNNAVGNAGRDRLGPNYVPSNKGGNPRVEANVFNHRLAIGYVGPERGLVNSGSSQDVDIPWIPTGWSDILSVANNLPNYGNSLTPSRPTIDAILDNDQVATRWVIGGPAALGTFGNPLAAPPEKGGLGWMEPFQDTNANNMYDLGEPFNDLNNNGIRDAVEARPAIFDSPTYPKMRNAEAAALINNITRSIVAFVDLPGSDQTVFTPGELAATQYILNGALPRVQTLTDPTLLAVNPDFNTSLQSFIRTQAGNIQADPAYAAFGTGVAPATPANSPAGKVPSRFIPAVGMSTYSDASFNPNADKYVGFGTNGTNGPTLTYATNLPIANFVSGDFNADGLRNWNDAAGIVGAWRRRQGLGTWTPPAAATGALATAAATSGWAYNAADFCIEIVGDFNGDGSYTLADVRYWADGLAINPDTGRLNRSEGFKRVDQASQSQGGNLNFFGTILGNGASVANNINTYKAGYSSADIAGTGRVARGWAPVGADGRVNGADIDYVWAQLRATDNLGNPVVTGGEVDWQNDLAAAAYTDLSADVNGDLKINAADVQFIVETVLCTKLGDVNLDGFVNATDLVGLPAFGSPAGWAQGDMNGDGIYDADDLAIIMANAGGFRPCCVGDINGDGVVDLADLLDFLSGWNPNLGSSVAVGLSGDFNGDGVVDLADLLDFLGGWNPNLGSSCN
ncbi:MAG: hypothetical protein KF768_10750 [Phycisphaeraceae bacterium]|nr:hypothetical protein [Phycisphaeraceae bacterium]